MKNAETKRFLEVIDVIIAKGLATGDADVIKKSQLSNSTISEMRAGRAGISIKNIQKIVKAFSVNADYIMKGDGPVFIDPENRTTPIDLIIKYENLKKDYEALDIKYKALEENYKRALQDLDYFKGLVNTLSGNKSDFKANRKVG